jgi:predicted RND superfamily exporter protein
MAAKNPLEISMKDTITAIWWVAVLVVVLFMFFVMNWTLLPIAVFGLGVVVSMGISAWGPNDVNKID